MSRSNKNGKSLEKGVHLAPVGKIVRYIYLGDHIDKVVAAVLIAVVKYPKIYRGIAFPFDLTPAWALAWARGIPRSGKLRLCLWISLSEIQLKKSLHQIIKFGSHILVVWCGLVLNHEGANGALN